MERIYQFRMENQPDKVNPQGMYCDSYAFMQVDQVDDTVADPGISKPGGAVPAR